MCRAESAAVKIHYEVTIEDLVSFSVYFNNNSKTVRRVKTIYLFGVPLLVAGLNLLVLLIVSSTDGMDDETLLETIVFSAFFTALFTLFWAIVWPRRFQDMLARNARKLYSEGSTAGTVGPHVLELGDRGLIERTPIGESQIYYHALEKIVENEDYTYIFRNAFTAYVIPHEEIASGDLDAFIDSLEQRMSIDGD